MSTEICTMTLQNAVNEIKDNVAQVSNILIFDDEKNLQIKDDSTSNENADNIANVTSEIIKRTNAYGGLKFLTINGENRQFAIARRFPLNFVDITDQNFDKESGKAISQILAPTILRIAETLRISPNHEELEIETSEEITIQTEPEVQEQEEPTETSEPIQEEESEPLVTQFMVEDLKSLSGLIRSKDSVQVDTEIISKWTKLYPDKNIKEVLIENVQSGKQTKCRFKPIKDSKLCRKGVIQIPDKIQSKIKAKKGSLVTVTPVL